VNYEEFLHEKMTVWQSCGFEGKDYNRALYGFQRDIVRWALAKGRAAIFADCGLGKTLMQLEWARQVHQHTGGNVLILAPLAVADQTKAEGWQFDIPVTVCSDASDVAPGINITNYEKLDRFQGVSFSGVVLDESSILKSFTGKIRTALIERFASVPYRLACTATPAPNDYMELGNHAEFLGVMSRNEMLSMYFVHDGGDTAKWRLKGHAEDIFWQWLGSWAVVLNNPADLGYHEVSYALPALHVHECIVDGSEPVREPMTLIQRRQARRDSLEERCRAAADLVNQSEEQWLVWCDLNDESKLLATLIKDAVEVKGSDKAQHKSDAMLDFSMGLIKCLVTKPSIAGFGMNWQQCHNMIFVGLSDSYEQYYQALRRCWRFGQEVEVHAYIIISAKEGCVKENIERKQQDAEKMQRAMVAYTREITKEELQQTSRISTPYRPTIELQIPEWREFQLGSTTAACAG